ncbi:hypothetical protein DV736_g205, partial [Chaetothyriales sp. CBS 134916]
MASDSSKLAPTGKYSNVRDSRLRAAVVQHSQMVQEKKILQGRIADLIVECAELPSEPITDPANASAQDVAKFKEAVSLFQPSDLDDLVVERNIADRCGYSLCPRPKRKAPHDGSHVWSNDIGFFVDRAEYERWCAKKCKQRTVFVRAQLSTEPAWLRDDKAVVVALLDETGPGTDLLRALNDLSISGSNEAELVAKLKDLSVERGDGDNAVPANISIVEREPNNDNNELVSPPRPGPADLIEGLPTRIQPNQRP